MYVDAILDNKHDKILVVERTNGQREYRTFPADYVFYYDDPDGEYRTVNDTSVSRISSNKKKKFLEKLSAYDKNEVWESDINPVFRCLSDNYLGKNSPDLHVCFFDIEVDFDIEKGYSTPEDPFNRVTAITAYLGWSDSLVTFALPPENLDRQEAENAISDFNDTFLFDDEKELLLVFLELIEDADVLSGWNSETYDIPYLVQRIERILGKEHTRKFCLWDAYPKKRIFERFGAENIAFDLSGRQHLDYMQLYRKFSYEERHSYSLDAIGEYELGERKVVYDGTLDQLYKQDFHTFIDYNRQDTLLLKKLDEKLKFIDLANELAHDNTVLLGTIMGTVAVTEQAIINQAHMMGMIVPNRQKNDHDIKVAGAYVANPKIGLHDWIGSIDLNSLYPSVIRSLNMAPETILGQIRSTDTDELIGKKIDEGDSFAAAWTGLFGTLEYSRFLNKEDTMLIVDWIDGTATSYTGKELWDLITSSSFVISANGTIFNTEKEGVIPKLIEQWQIERKELQKNKREDEENREFWDRRQLVKKINLNSIYGAILNPACRFYDKNIGQSVTLTGRAITKHMAAEINALIIDEYDHEGKCIIYGDTDSAYFSIWHTLGEWQKENWKEKDIYIEVYDYIAEMVNRTFPKFMKSAFNCNDDDIIKAGREIVARKGLFITKKRYAVMAVDNDGIPVDNEVKSVGLDLRRSDTPKFMQEFLGEILHDVLKDVDSESIIDKIRNFKEKFRNMPGWEKGTPKRVNNLTSYAASEKSVGKVNMPGHVRAAMNWNDMRIMQNDLNSMPIIDGSKTIVCALKNNMMGYKSIGYPIDEMNLPEWFKQLPFDHEKMESVIVDQKLENLMGVLEWDIRNRTKMINNFDTIFKKI